MPTRSVNLKMILDRSAKGDGVRRALWTTHAAVNEAVAEIERVLLLCRGESYVNSDGEVVPRERVRKQALALARRAQKNNGRTSKTGTDGEILDALRKLYESIVPSCKIDTEGRPAKGDAKQIGNSFASPLMDAKSEGFQSVFDKILDPPPKWIGEMDAGKPGWEKHSIAWARSEESQRLQRAPGSPSAWVRRLRKDQPWQGSFVEDQAKKRREVCGVPALMRRLKQDFRYPATALPTDCVAHSRKGGRPKPVGPVGGPPRGRSPSLLGKPESPRCQGTSPSR